jgi:hypothetical protein
VQIGICSSTGTTDILERATMNTAVDHQLDDPAAARRQQTAGA